MWFSLIRRWILSVFICVYWHQAGSVFGPEISQAVLHSVRLNFVLGRESIRVSRVYWHFIGLKSLQILRMRHASREVGLHWLGLRAFIVYFVLPLIGNQLFIWWSISFLDKVDCLVWLLIPLSECLLLHVDLLDFDILFEWPLPALLVFEMLNP